VAFNPSYSGGKDWRITVQSHPWHIVFETLSQKYPLQKRSDGVTQGVGPEFKPKKEKKKAAVQPVMKGYENRKYPVENYPRLSEFCVGCV
jgi:hypothetical protein